MVSDSKVRLRPACDSTLIVENVAGVHQKVESDCGRLRRQVRADLAASARYHARAASALTSGRAANAHELKARALLAEARAIRRQARALRVGASR